MTTRTTLRCPCGRPTTGTPLCPQCRTTANHALINIGYYWTDLDTVAAKQTRYTRTNTGGAGIGKAQPLPVDTRFLDTRPLAPTALLRKAVRTTLTHWTRTTTRAHPPPAGPPCTPPGTSCLHTSCAHLRRHTINRRTIRTIPAQIEYLARHHTWLLAQPTAPDYLNDLLDLERRLAHLVDRPPVRWYAGKCTTPQADDTTCLAELYATAESGTVRCPRCGTSHDIGTRRDFLLHEARNVEVTATEAARALLSWTDYDGSEKRLVDRIAYWRDKGDLEPADVVIAGGRYRHLYRLGDIQVLLVGVAAAKQAEVLRS